MRAKKVALATNAFPPLLKRLSYYIVPVYDYVLMIEPLNPSQRESIGWEKRMGIGDAGNQFHYYRTSVDGRILFGGYDAVYHWYNGFGSHLESDYDSLKEEPFARPPFFRYLFANCVSSIVIYNGVDIITSEPPCILTPSVVKI